MRPRSKPRLFVCFAALVAAGCGREPERVYVSLDKVVLGEAPGVSLSSHALQERRPFPGGRAELGTLPARNLNLPVTRERIDSAMELVKASEQSAYDALVRQLRDIRVAEIVREYNARLEQLHPSLAKARQDVLKKVHEEMRRRAPDRGYAMARVALLVGFPDPDPLSERDFEPGSKRGEMRIEEARTWREIIRTIDADVDDLAAKLDAEAVDSYYKAVADVYAEMDQAKRDAEAEAKRLAEAQRAKSGQGIESVLTGGERARLRAVPGATVATVAGPVPARRMDPFARSGDPAESARARAESDLKVWLAVNGFELASSKGAARDATEDFISWRKAQRTGR